MKHKVLATALALPVLAVGLVAVAHEVSRASQPKAKLPRMLMPGQSVALAYREFGFAHVCFGGEGGKSSFQCFKLISASNRLAPDG